MHAPLERLHALPACSQEALAVGVDALRAYLAPMRFYTRYYPYFGYRAGMVHIALERTRQVGGCMCCMW